MEIEIQKIIEYCYDEVSFFNGEQLFNERKVDNIRIEEMPAGGVFISADIKESLENTYKTQAIIDPSSTNRPIKTSSCNCIGFSSNTGGCKHVVALILEYNFIDTGVGLENFQNNKTKYVKQTSKQIKEMLNYYVLKDRNKICKDYANGSVELEPTLIHRENKNVEIEFKIGIKQKYIIKSIYNFLKNIENSKLVRYGRRLEFKHNQSAFNEKSLKLIEILISLKKDIEKREMYNYKKDSLVDAKRNVVLNEDSIDKLMDIYESNYLKFNSEYSKNNTKILLLEQDIKLPIKIIRNENEDGATIKFPYIEIIKGRYKIGIIYNDIMYISNRKQFEYIENFIEVIADTKNRLDEKEIEFHISDNDLKIFIDTVMPIFSQYFEIKFEEINIKEYEFKDGKYKIYLDYDENTKVKCRVVVDYENEEFNLLDIANTKQSFRNVRQEFKIKNMIGKYFECIVNEEFVIEEEYELIYELIEKGIPNFREIGEVFIAKDFKSVNIVNAPKITTGISITGNLLKFDWDIDALDIEDIEKILKEYRLKKKYHKLKDGSLLKLQDNSITFLSEIVDGLNISKEDLKKGKIEVPAYRAFYIEALINENYNNISFNSDENYKKLIHEIEENIETEITIPDTIEAELKNYQINGFCWLKTLAKFGFGGILADDMGLGKTLQAITFIESNKSEGVTLVICPASLVYNWQSECMSFAPKLKTIAVVGKATERVEIIEAYKNYNVLITSYDLLKRDIELYENKKFMCQIIDEAQYIKNPGTMASKAVKTINATVRFALTGTPIENRLSELWSIFDYILPGYLYKYSKFREEFEENIIESKDKNKIDRLHSMIKPFILRRLKKDVLSDLPEKLEKVIYAKMDVDQKEIYVANEQKLINDIKVKSEKEYKKGKIEILSALTKLRQICCDPSLTFENYDGKSAKLETCIELMREAIASGHKVLLFSQFTTMLDKIAKKLEQEQISYFMLTGKTTKPKRKELVEKFQNKEADVFLISLKAGGTGLNLTAADIVIHYDPWWNAAAQNQATDRAHRIGQDNKVTVFKLIVKNTIEERILKLQELKSDLANSIISESGISISGVSRQELLEIIEQNKN